MNSENAADYSDFSTSILFTMKHYHYKDYVEAVLARYEAGTSKGKLSSRLSMPTPAKLREECIDVCRERFHKRDDDTLRVFFGSSGEAAVHIRAIEHFELDKFKPLINFLKRETAETDKKNIELLAWLIDFMPRSFYRWKESGIVEERKEGESPNVEDGVEETSETMPGDEQPSGQAIKTGMTPTKMSTRWLRAAVLITALLSFAVAGGYFSRQHTAAETKEEEGGACMYWKDDHYERIACDQKSPYTTAIALDTFLLKNFKRIMVPDSINAGSIGKVWYTKIDGVPEFYTTMGYHPIHKDKQLKPITKYIINTYVLAKTRLINTPDQKLSSPSPGKPFRRFGQCQGITRAKTRCLHPAKSDGYCWQHKKPGV